MQGRGNRKGENRRREGTLILVGAAIALAQIVLASPTQAQSPVCRQLLAQAKQSTGSSSVRGLERDLARSLAQADRRGCFGGFFFRARGKGCGALLKRIDRLEDMIHQPRRSRSNEWVKRELARNGCFEKSPVETANVAPAGEYRTVCVRSCDGYFFPLGFSQSKGDFKRDREMCRSMYGDAAADLYFYPSDASSDKMVSLDGEAYAKQSFAFAYQHKFQPACQAELQRGFQRLRDSFFTVASRDSFRRFKLIPTPVQRPQDDPPVIPEAGVSHPPKTVSRILPSFPTYVTEATSIPNETSAADPRNEKYSDLLDVLRDWIAPQAKADAAE
jgi:hypothetical protein